MFDGPSCQVGVGSRFRANGLPSAESLPENDSRPRFALRTSKPNPTLIVLPVLSAAGLVAEGFSITILRRARSRFHIPELGDLADGYRHALAKVATTV